MNVLKKCQQCGREYKVYNYRAKESKYCCRECYHIASRKEEQKKCLNCGALFTIESKHKNKKFCNVACACEYKRKQPKVATIGKDGYMYVWQTDGTSIKEHILVMENFLGRKLKKGECVHHRDFNRANNNIENLQLMTISEHSRLHRKLELENGKILFGGSRGGK